MAADVRDEGAVAAAVAGADGVVNAVSAYLEQGGITYRDIHERGAGNIASRCIERKPRWQRTRYHTPARGLRVSGLTQPRSVGSLRLPRWQTIRGDLQR